VIAMTDTSTGGVMPPKPDPDGKNVSRAAWAAAAIVAFQEVTGSDDCDALGDLLADLMHWCDETGQDFEQALRNGRSHYEAETTDPEAEG
jgi:hypothetical protein